MRLVGPGDRLGPAPVIVRGSADAALQVGGGETPAAVREAARDGTARRLPVEGLVHVDAAHLNGADGREACNRGTASFVSPPSSSMILRSNPTHDHRAERHIKRLTRAITGTLMVWAVGCAEPEPPAPPVPVPLATTPPLPPIV